MYIINRRGIFRPLYIHGGASVQRKGDRKRLEKKILLCGIQFFPANFPISPEKSRHCIYFSGNLCYNTVGYRSTCGIHLSERTSI